MKMQRISAFILAGFVVFAIVAASCAPAPTPAPTPAPPTAAPAATTALAATSAPAATVVPPTATVAARPKTRLSIATGTVAAVYYPYGGGLAALISKNVTNVEATAEATAASVDNMKLIQSGKADLAITMSDTAFDALKGQGPFKDSGAVPVRALAILYSNYTHIVVTDDSGIKTIADMKGKRVSTGPPNSGVEVMAVRLLDAVGLDPDKDLQRQRLSPADSANAIKDRKMDAFFWTGGLPTPAIQELVNTPGAKVRFLANTEYIPKLVDKWGPFYFKLTIPKATYAGMDGDADVIGIANMLVVNEKFDACIAYEILKMMVDKQSDLALIHDEAKRFGLPQATVGSPLPFHPGAVKFYADKGLTVK